MNYFKLIAKLSTFLIVLAVSQNLLSKEAVVKQNPAPSVSKQSYEQGTKANKWKLDKKFAEIAKWQHRQYSACNTVETNCKSSCSREVPELFDSCIQFCDSPVPCQQKGSELAQQYRDEAKLDYTESVMIDKQNIAINTGTIEAEECVSGVDVGSRLKNEILASVSAEAKTEKEAIKDFSFKSHNASSSIANVNKADTKVLCQ
ncbi:hypothetical protein ISG33_16195 [Glaciecola sp. MH2013]|uniref:hypothetical protein n=1 Tax=Glaciecola sp. MH2013 TaxID=2785524 RepID=UPI00189E3FB3|nr:hypothetical protein [Glaciecola sp. MH2013]MBF7074944.1 hypothetical protein [Glaciecola sp. MH2013]